MIGFCTHFAQLFYQYFYDPLIDIDISQRFPIANIDIDKISNRLEFGISNSTTTHPSGNDVKCIVHDVIIFIHNFIPLQF